MAKVTLTNDDGSTVDFNDQAFTDAAVQAAIAAVPATPTVEVTDAGVTITHTDGSSQDFIPATAPVEAPVEAELPAAEPAPEEAPAA